MTNQNLLLQEGGYPSAPADIKQALRDVRNHAAVAHIDQLERELAEARKDAERLDWLMAQGGDGCVVQEGPNIQFWLCWLDEYSDARTYQDGAYESGRAAIDAAMKDKP